MQSNDKPKDSTGQNSDRNVRKKPSTEKRIDKALEDTFPASDPPQWDGVANKGSSTGKVKRGL